MQLAEAFARGAYGESAALEAEVERAFEGFGLAIGDVEHRRHAVAVLGGESACGESDGAYHIGIDDGEAFLLAGGNELRSIDFNTVDVHRVLVKGAAAYAILRGHLVALRDAGHSGNEALNAAAADIGRQSVAVSIDSLDCACLFLVIGDGDAFQCDGDGFHLDIEGGLALGAYDASCHLVVADAGEHHAYGVRRRGC